MARVFLSLGSNIEPRTHYLREAIEGICRCEVNILKRSSVYETEPWGNPNQEAFLNCVIMGEAALLPVVLWNKLIRLEKSIGGDKTERWGPRRLDIDILFYDDVILETDTLVIPHPRLHLRRFVLIPLNEIAPELIHPGLGQPVKALLSHCPDNLNVTRLDFCHAV